MTRFFPIMVLSLLLLLTGCASFVSNRAQDLAHHIGQAVLNSDDVETVKEAVPAYLLLMEGLLQQRPNDPGLLQSAANMYSGYASLFLDDDQRALELSQKALVKALQVACLKHASLCDLRTQSYSAFQNQIDALPAKDLDWLYVLGMAWASRIQAAPSDWHAVAELPKVTAILNRVIALDDSYDQGQAHLILAVMNTLLPAVMGGKPEQGRRHFEAAIHWSHEHNLLAKVLFAKMYARLVFDQKLHDRLLQEVIAAPVMAEGFTLSNTMAKEQAKTLLAASTEFF